jgi:hypothetical protein
MTFGYNTIQQFLLAFYINRQYTIGNHFLNTFHVTVHSSFMDQISM